MEQETEDVDAGFGEEVVGKVYFVEVVKAEKGRVQKFEVVGSGRGRAEVYELDLLAFLDCVCE